MKAFLVLFLSVALALVASSPSAIFANEAPIDASEHELVDGIASLQTVGPFRDPRTGVDSVRRWSDIAGFAVALDHTPPGPSEVRSFRKQMGPGRSSRAMAMVHIAMFEAINATSGKYKSYIGLKMSSEALSLDAAVSQAAHDVLVALYPDPTPVSYFDQWLAEDLAKVTNVRDKSRGIFLGRKVAGYVLAMRASDGSDHPELFMPDDYTPSDLPGRWRMDPVSLIPVVLGLNWDEVLPFAVQSASQFRAPPPPALTSPEYAADYDEVLRLGGDGVVTPTERTEDQTEAGIFWAYDGVAKIGTPPVLFTQIAVHIADQRGTKALETARLLALVNMAMADTTLNVWESKYYYDFWRPVTGIREADPGTGPSLLGDGNPDTVGDPSYMPLGAPASNGTGMYNFSPPFPAYPSGHAGMGGAAFQTLRRFYGTDNIPFTFVSDELNGATLNLDGSVRPLSPRSFTTLSQAEEENAQSRIYLGVHWGFDKRSVQMGRDVANYIFDRQLVPLKAK